MDNQSAPAQITPQQMVPKPAVSEIPQFGMWVGFLYIVYFIALYVWATSFGNILHEVVNRYVPDALEKEESLRYFYYFGRDNIIRWSLASIIIFYPIFVLIHLLIERLKINRSEVINIRARKILIYITLVGTLLIACYQLVKFVYAFLDGSMSTRTVSHFGVTLTIAVLIFVFYVFQVRKDRGNA